MMRILAKEHSLRNNMKAARISNTSAFINNNTVKSEATTTIRTTTTGVRKTYGYAHQDDKAVHAFLCSP